MAQDRGGIKIYIVYHAECLSLRRNWVPLPLPPPLFIVLPPLDAKWGGSNTPLRVRDMGGPIRTTGKKAWHSVYSVHRLTRMSQD
jgi:hypothetical protein